VTVSKHLQFLAVKEDRPNRTIFQFENGNLDRRESLRTDSADYFQKLARVSFSLSPATIKNKL
jgi:hypothetical protein